MDKTFYIVAEELALLPPEVKKAWRSRMQKESLTAYETPEQIDARMSSASYEKYPALQQQINGYVAAFKRGESPVVTFTDFPEEAVDTFLFSIGASGISMLIDLYLRQQSVLESPNMMESVAALSRARHKILEKNQLVFH